MSGTSSSSSAGSMGVSTAASTYQLATMAAHTPALAGKSKVYNSSTDPTKLNTYTITFTVI